ncbi:MAG TPA: ComEA family DNA-binding protein [Clostridiales bacterium]|nr:ComEA family DNA-binding protein [Clostridiales bacterium]
MKNKHVTVIIACLFLILAGVSYSCSYRKNRGQEIVLTSVHNAQGDQEISKTEIMTGDSLCTEDCPDTESGQRGNEEDDLKETVIYVHICGAVVNPDVYKLERGTRLVELIDIAGGLTPDAADDYINQAMTVEDGQRIYIPTAEEIKELGVYDYLTGDNTYRANDKTNKKVNINTADETELMSLPGIGQAKARSIVEYRKKNGNFKSVNDLTNISGIKEGLLDKIKDFVTVK